jgi:hypothetical protein
LLAEALLAPRNGTPCHQATSEFAVGCSIFPIGDLAVNVGRTLFSQIIDFVPRVMP